MRQFLGSDLRPAESPAQPPAHKGEARRGLRALGPLALALCAAILAAPGAPALGQDEAWADETGLEAGLAAEAVATVDPIFADGFESGAVCTWDTGDGLETPCPLATCWRCSGLSCLLAPPDSVTCEQFDDVCTIRVDDTVPGARQISRDCLDFPVAQAQAGANAANCENVVDGLQPGLVCVFACDGQQHPDCNIAPDLIPDQGRLFAP